MSFFQKRATYSLIVLTQFFTLGLLLFMPELLEESEQSSVYHAALIATVSLLAYYMCMLWQTENRHPVIISPLHLVIRVFYAAMIGFCLYHELRAHFHLLRFCLALAEIDSFTLLLLLLAERRRKTGEYV